MLPSPLLLLRRRTIGFRNRLVASPKFRAAALRLPGGRSAAAAYAMEAFVLVSGFVRSQILSAAWTSGLLAELARGPTDARTLSDRCRLPIEGTERLLRASVAARLVELSDPNDFALTALGVAIASDSGITAMIGHHALLYADLADPLALLRGESIGKLASFWSYSEAERSPLTAQAYSDLMAASQTMIADEILGAYDFRRHRRVLDVGGGRGTFLERLAASKSGVGIDRAVFDLPDVAAAADPSIKRFEGDFLKDPLPEGFDLVTLVRVLHDHDDAAMLRILGAAKAAMRPGAVLLIGEPMAGSDSAGAAVAAYFEMYLLAMGSGRPRTPAELTSALTRSGFRSIRRRRTALPLLASVITGVA